MQKAFHEIRLNLLRGNVVFEFMLGRKYLVVLFYPLLRKRKTGRADLSIFGQRGGKGCTSLNLLMVLGTNLIQPAFRAFLASTIFAFCRAHFVSKPIICLAWIVRSIRSKGQDHREFFGRFRYGLAIGLS